MPTIEESKNFFEIKMMTEKTYQHIDYIWHLVVLRVLIMLPLLTFRTLSQVSLGIFEGLYEVFDKMLPAHYKQTEVPFEQLSKWEQEEYQRLAKARGGILSQVQKS